MKWYIFFFFSSLLLLLSQCAHTIRNENDEKDKCEKCTQYTDCVDPQPEQQRTKPSIEKIVSYEEHTQIAVFIAHNSL